MDDVSATVVSVGRRWTWSMVLAVATMLIAGLIPSITAADAATAGTSGQAKLSLPAPTGPYAVGVRSASVFDPTRIDKTTGRARRLPIRVWYPARGDPAGPSAPYLSRRIQKTLETEFGLPSGLLDIDTHASTDAPGRRHLRGVILAQPGAGNLVAFQTGQVIELASRGYAVVTMDHPHETLVVEEPDGTLIHGEDPESRPFTERLLDAAAVLSELPRLVPQAGRRTPIGMFGHSRGGATTAEVMFHHPRVVAGVDLDGSLRGDVVAAGLDQPFGVMVSREFPLDDPGLAAFLAKLRGPHPTRQLDVLHNGYTDWVVFNPQAARADPALGAKLEGLLPTGTVHSQRAGRRALSAQRQFLTRFMKCYLTNDEVRRSCDRHLRHTP